MSGSAKPADPQSAGSTSEPSDEDAGSHTPPKLGNELKAPLRRPFEWLFLLENRLLIAGGLLATLLALLFGVELMTSFADQGLQPLFYVFGALIGGNFTLITIVISISQLVISQQLGSPGDLRRRIEETNQYRDAVEDRIDRTVAPVTPTDFLQLLLEQTETVLGTIRDELEGIPDGSGREELDDLVSGLQSHVEHVNSLLSRSEVGLFEALSVTLQTNYSREIHRSRAIEGEYGDQLSDEIDEALDELVVRLQQIDVARQYLKTLYMQNELSRISRLLLYTGTPAVVVAMLMMHQFAASAGGILEPTILSALVPVALTIGVAPLAVLFAFVLRISVVAQRTLAITPFTTPQQERNLLPDSVTETHRPGADRTGGN